MRLILLMISAACLMSCVKMPQKPTKTYAETTGIGLQHDASVEVPPEVHQDTKQEKGEIPPGSTITRTETPKSEGQPASTVTVIELPKDKGMSFSAISTKTDMVGSKGFTPPKAATPTQKATAGWTYAGIAICALGIFFCTPWGGSNFRIGAVIACGGIAMSVVGKVIDQITVPAPAMGFGFAIFALAMYYGYRIRHKQAEASTPQ